jgi:2Fe-2S ferredoxin
MPLITIIDRSGEETTIQAQTGLSLMEVVKAAGFDELLAMCGGNCSCATCHVYIDKGHPDLPPPDELELALLETSTHVGAHSRLGCQIPVADSMDGLRVTIAPED